MKTIEIISGEQRAIFTTRSVTFDGKEFLYINMSDVSDDTEAHIYTFTYDGETKQLPYEAKDAPILKAIFSQVSNMKHKAPAAAAQVPKPAAAVTAEDIKAAVSKGTGESDIKTTDTEAPENVQADNGAAASEEDASATGQQPQGGMSEKEARKAEKARRKEEKRLAKEKKKAEKAAAKAAKAEAAKAEAEAAAAKTAEAESSETAGTPVADETAGSETTPSTPADADVETDSTETAQTIASAEDGSAIDGTEATAESSAAHEAGKAEEDSAAKEAEDTEAAASRSIFTLLRSSSENTDPEKQARFKKSILIFVVIVAVIAVMALIYFFVFGTSDDPSAINPSATDTQTYEDIDELIEDLQ